MGWDRYLESQQKQIEKLVVGGKILLQKEYGMEEVTDIEEDIFDVLPDGEWDGIVTITVAYKKGDD